MEHNTAYDNKGFDEKGQNGHVGVYPVEDPNWEREHEGDLQTTTHGDHGTHRVLKPRVVSMIAIAGTIGTGLFLGSGGALTIGGPVGMWLAYTLMGMGVGCMMISMGEMTVYCPNIGGFIEMATKYVDPALGFAMGFNYMLQVGFGIPSELSAIAVLFSFWDKDANHAAIYIAVFLVIMALINVIGVKWYGEIEFVFACIKVTTLIGLILFGLIADLGGIPPKHEYIGGRYWRHEPFNDNFKGLNIKPVGLSRLLGFWGVLTKSAFAYATVESVGIMAGEAHNPRRTLRMAVRTVFYRIVGIYCLSTMIIGLTVSQTDPNLLRGLKEGSGTAAASPFVVVCVTFGVKVLPHIINGVVVTSALSSGNEQTYALSRSMMSMARNGLMPKFFLRTTRLGVPWPGVIVACSFALLSFLSVSNTSEVAFNWLTNLSALSSLFTWIFICIAYVRFKKALAVQGIDRSKLTLKGWFQPYLAWFCIIWFSLILILNGFASFMPKWNASEFFAAYITIPCVVLSYVIWKIVKRTRIVPLDEVDLSGGPEEALAGTRYDTSLYPNGRGVHNGGAYTKPHNGTDYAVAH